MSYVIDQECDNNIKKKSIFKITTLHNFNKGCWWNNSSLFFQLHNKLSNAQPTLKEVSLFLIICIIQCFFSILYKNIKQNQMFISWLTVLEKIMKNNNNVKKNQSFVIEHWRKSNACLIFIFLRRIEWPPNSFLLKGTW